MSRPEDNAQTKSEPQISEYAHPNFQRVRPELCRLITTKGKKENLDYQTMVGIMNDIKDQNMTLSQDLKCVQADNLTLWEDHSDARARHVKQQDMIENILNFLGSVYGRKRHDDKSIKPKKRQSLEQPETNEELAIVNSITDDERTRETFDEMIHDTITMAMKLGRKTIALRRHFLSHNEREEKTIQ